MLLNSFILGKWGTELENKGRYDDLFKCYEQAVDVFPDNENILNNLGAHLLRYIFSIFFFKLKKNGATFLSFQLKC